MDPNPTARHIPRFIWPALVLLVLISLAYANSLEVPFLFDDETVIKKHSRSTDYFLSLSSVKYRHLFYGSFALNYLLGGENTLGYHALNLLLHFSTAFLFFVIAYLTVEKSTSWGKNAAASIAFAGALFFALNPVHTEAVTYLSGRASGLSAFFFTLGLLCFLLGSLKGTSRWRAPLFYFASLVAFVSGVLTKETTLTLPLIILLYDFYFIKGNAWVSLRDRILYFYLPVPLMAAFFVFKSFSLMALAKWWAQQFDPLYFFLQVKIVPYTLGLYFFPINLTFDYDFNNVFDPLDPGFLLSAVFFILLAWLILRNFFIDSPLLSFSVLWFFITLAPTNSFLPRPDFFSERNLYLPSIGLSLFPGVAFYLLFLGNQRKRWLVLPATACLLAVLCMNSALLIHRNSVYLTSASLWDDTRQKSPRKLRGYQNLTRSYLLAGDYKNAFIVLNQMLHLNPSYYFTRLNLGKLYVHLGQPARAEREFLKAIEIDSGPPEGYFNLGSLYASVGQYHEALKQYNKIRVYTLDRDKQLDLLLDKARVYLQLKNYSAADFLAHSFLKKAGARAAEGHLLGGQIYKRWGKKDLAIGEYRKVLGSPSLRAVAHNDIGIIYVKQNRTGRAVQEFEQAISLNPGFLEAHFNLGKILIEKTGTKETGRRHLETALSLTADPEKIQTLRKLLQTAGKE